MHGVKVGHGVLHAVGCDTDGAKGYPPCCLGYMVWGIWCGVYGVGYMVWGTCLWSAHAFTVVQGCSAIHTRTHSTYHFFPAGQCFPGK